MKFHFSFKYFLLGLVIVLATNYQSFVWEKTNNDEKQTTWENILSVEVGDIKNSIEAVWNAELVDEQSLSFNKAWTITAVYFKAWESIKKWDIIAEIDSSDAYNSIEDAEISLENAKINLKELYEWADESQILQLKNSITSAENALITAEKEFENIKISQKNSLDEMLENIETSKKELENSEANLELAKKELETQKKEQINSLDNTSVNKSTTVKNIEDSLKSNLVEIEKIIDEIDIVLGITDKNEEKNDDYDYFLWAKDSGIKSEAKTSFRKTLSLYESLKEELENYDYSGEKEILIPLLESYKEVYDSLYESADLTYKTADNSIESVGSLSSAEIESMKNSFSSYRSTALSKASTINNSIATLSTLSDTDLISESNNLTLAWKEESIKQSELSLEKQELSIQNAIKNYEETKASYSLTTETKENEIETKKVSLEIAKLNLEELLEWPTEENVRKANNSIRQAEIKLENAYKDLEDYQLIAPFDGIVRKIDYMVGDNLTNDTDKYVYIENPNLLEISIMLDQIDITQVEMGDDAIITFDAYQTTPANGKVSSIDTTPIESSWVVSYEVKIIIADESFDKTVLSWMTADIEIITESKTDIVLLKSSAITEKNGKYFVSVLKNGTTEEREIETGIVSNGMTEIISGLEAGESVITKSFTSTTNTSEATQTTTLFWPWSWAGRWDRTQPPF